MSEADSNHPQEAEVSELESERQDDPIVEEEAEAAAAEAAEIGGPAPDDPVDDPAERPVVEGGGGQAEGFELAEQELIENASHDADSNPDPSHMAGREEASDPTAQSYGEADEEEKEDL